MDISEGNQSFVRHAGRELTGIMAILCYSTIVIIALFLGYDGYLVLSAGTILTGLATFKIVKRFDNIKIADLLDHIEKYKEYHRKVVELYEAREEKRVT